MELTKPVTVVVPLVAEHDKYVKSLIDQLEPDRHLIEKVILARSSSKHRHLQRLSQALDRLALESEIPIQVVATKRQQLAGQNRNRGWREVSSEFTAFLDADDEYAPNRIESLLKVAREENSDLVLHAFAMDSHEFQSLRQGYSSSAEIVRTEALFETTFTDGRNRELEGAKPGDTNIFIPTIAGEVPMAHHGHVFVRTALRERFQYGTLYPGEDGQFCRDVLWGGFQVTYVHARLSAYRPHRSAGYRAGWIPRGRRRVSGLASKWTQSMD